MSEETVENVEQEVEEIEETQVEDEAAEETTEDEQQEETEEEQEEESELEEWQKEDESVDEDKETKFPKSLKAKKRLKGELAKKDDENERLRQELEALKKQQSSPVNTAGIKIPNQIDFETDEEYNQAVANYTLAVLETKQKQTQEEEKIKQAIEKIRSDTDAHYERAEKLMESSGIAPEKYKASDSKLRQTVEAVLPGKGDIATDRFLGLIGEGSEKVGYYIGNNESARAKFQSLLIEDPSGIKAAIYLGEQKNRLSNTNSKKQTSKAAPPAPSVSGDAKSSSETNLKRKWAEAHKEGDVQKAYNLKRQAKKDGIDVKKWK